MVKSMTLSELLGTCGGSIKTGPFGTTLKAAEYSTDGTPVISVGEVGNGSIKLTEKTPRVGRQVVDRLPEYVLKHGDIVFGRKGAVERSAWVREHEHGYFLGSDGIRVRFGPGVSSRFFAYQLRSELVRDWLVQHAAGTTMPSLNQKILERVVLSVPNLAVQRAIAEVLGALDDKIAANESLASHASELMRALGSAATGLVRLSDVAVHEATSLRPTDFAEQVSHFSIPAFDAGAVPEEAGGATIKSNKFVLNGPRVLVSKLNPRIPRIWNVSRLPETMSLASTEFVVLAPTEVGHSALWSVLNQPAFVNDLRSRVAGTSGSHQRVRPAEMLDATVPDPRSLTDRQLRSVDALGTYVDLIKVESRQLATTRNELLPLLMSGKVRVRDAEKIVEEAV